MAVTHLTIPGELKTVEEVEEAALNLTKELAYIADVACPKRKRNQGTNAIWWNREVKDVTAEARRAERAWRRSRTEASLKHLRAAVLE